MGARMSLLVEDLKSFRRWRFSGEAPESGEIAFLDGCVWVDESREELFTHNQVRAALYFAIAGVTKAESLGLFVPRGMMFSNTNANLNTEPDGLFASWETLRSGHLRMIEEEDGSILELGGTPDQVLEVVSDTSQRKDTVVLRDLYWKAGIPEYWLVDVRGGAMSFEILQWTTEGYVATPSEDGWIASKVFGRKFQLQKKTDPLGHPQFVVNVDAPG